MKLESVNWPGGQSQNESYHQSFERVSSLYEYNPHTEVSWKERLDWLQRPDRPQADRSKLAEIVTAYNKRMGAGPQSVANARLLAEATTMVVIGGQQAGLFTGQLLVIYKAMNIIQEARSASARLGVPVVPVFWIAGEDHDFDEASHTYILNRQAEVERLQLQHPTGKREPVSALKFTREAWEEGLAALEQGLQDTEFKPDLLGRLRDIHHQSDTLSEAFARTLAWLFADEGLVFIDAALPELRRLESGWFARLVSENRALSEAVWEGKEQVESLGFTPQAVVDREQAHLFILVDGERTMLYHDESDGFFRDRKGTVRFSEAELQDIAARRPELLSNNVMSRPLMQDYVFPVLGVVLGPSEVAYWGMLKQAFGALGMKMPVLLARRGFTLLEGTVQKQLNKYELTFDDVIQRIDAKRQAWLDAQDTLHLEPRFSDVKRQFADLYRPLLDTAASLNPGLGKLGETNLQKILEQIDFMQARALDAHKSQYEAGLRQFDRVKTAILPLGKPQERVYNIFVYLNKFGSGWIRELMQSSSAMSSLHAAVYF
ncbi:bacillithiol biosynthesis cysteine-adding enzyme BshC [Paenibacillus sp. y28]|uniref:bacillithiol biosynthesis cysteine-adding enzyme BshC n=1 Tax=Paenibacillus sp. y28 TaxID=3129110 RepID=UPI0030193F5C